MHALAYGVGALGERLGFPADAVTELQCQAERAGADSVFMAELSRWQQLLPEKELYPCVGFPFFHAAGQYTLRAHVAVSSFADCAFFRTACWLYGTPQSCRRQRSAISGWILVFLWPDSLTFLASEIAESGKVY